MSSPLIIEEINLFSGVVISHRGWSLEYLISTSLHQTTRSTACGCSNVGPACFKSKDVRHTTTLVQAECDRLWLAHQRSKRFYLSPQSCNSVPVSNELRLYTIIVAVTVWIAFKFIDLFQAHVQGWSGHEDCSLSKVTGRQVNLSTLSRNFTRVTPLDLLSQVKGTFWQHATGFNFLHKPRVSALNLSFVVSLRTVLCLTGL